MLPHGFSAVHAFGNVLLKENISHMPEKNNRYYPSSFLLFPIGQGNETRNGTQLSFGFCRAQCSIIVVPLQHATATSTQHNRLPPLASQPHGKTNLNKSHTKVRQKSLFPHTITILESWEKGLFPTSSATHGWKQRRWAPWPHASNAYDHNLTMTITTPRKIRSKRHKH